MKNKKIFVNLHTYALTISFKKEYKNIENILEESLNKLEDINKKSIEEMSNNILYYLSKIHNFSYEKGKILKSISKEYIGTLWITYIGSNHFSIAMDWDLYVRKDN